MAPSGCTLSIRAGRGLRKATIKIPEDYVTNGRVSLKTFDIGIINLELGFPGEERQKVLL
uniref:Chaperone DnaJ C-terminal domain-containing protein n=1 Tax=Parascaris equorum TaxID=6256 RepID=A0A914RBR9_PAREQ